jgi:hypothetical protein
MTAPAVTPTSLLEAVRIAVAHLRAVKRLRGRYGSDEHRQDQAEAALAVLERAVRAEDVTVETTTPGVIRPGAGVAHRGPRER